MDLKAVKTFQTIARFGSFQKAAEALNYVQSTVTMQIQKLEMDLGVKLFERGRKICLTEAGRVFLEKSSILLNDLEYVQSSMDEWLNGETGKIKVGAIEPMAIYRLPNILAPFCDEYPKVQMSIEINNSNRLTEMIKEGELDLAICNTPELDHTITFEPLLTEDVSILISDRHPFAEKKEIFLSDFNNERLLLSGFVCNYRIHLEMSLLKAGVTPQIGLEVNSMSALKEYVQAGLGIAVIPDIIVGTLPKGTVKRRIVDLEIGVVTGIVRKAKGIQNSKAVQRLITTIKESV
ncbi:LysR family transcriptional regulator [Bacillus sp. UNC41MFS5]|uniref:LysR family transcriptional regulator n=1 Tax=Bacillus sp. UNC41MFS5 TaxID=1449046 RepID=UPI000479CC2A|nr:LysR family transcriptional regulator [Bacillus sp. UNC41MFS5]